MQKSARPLLVEGSTFPALPFFLVGLVATAVLAYLSTEAAETGNSTLIVGAYGFPLVCFGVMVVASAWLLADPTRYEFYENGFKVRNREPGPTYTPTSKHGGLVSRILQSGSRYLKVTTSFT